MFHVLLDKAFKGPPPCDTCVMRLAGPPVAAMMCVKNARGLDPSVYGGGGPLSSRTSLGLAASSASFELLLSVAEGK